MAKEQWKTVPFAPDYAASSEGRIKRITNGTGLSRARAGHVLRPAAAGHKRAYLHLALSHGGKIRYHNVHRVIALTFLGDPPRPNDTVAHLDGNGSNNRVSNLRWATLAENHADKLAHGTHDRGTKNSQAKLSEAHVLAIRAGTLSNSKTAAEFGISESTVSRIRNRTRWAWL